MSMLDIFNSDAFSVTRLTDAMREIKYVPGRIGSMGLFGSYGIDTLSIAIEKDKEQNIFIVPAAPRGAPGMQFGKNKRSVRNLTIPHYPVEGAIYADEVQGVRAFGKESAIESLQGKIADRGAEVSQSFTLTEEYQRLEIIKTGILKDADGSTIFDFFSEFGETQETAVNMDLDAASPASGVLRKACASVVRKMSLELDGMNYSGIHALSGDAFFDDLIAHPEVVDTYKGYSAAASLRGGYVATGGMVAASFEFGGITWENYRSGQSVGVATDECHFVPLGVAGLFRTAYGPADYIETVNKKGQRLYAKQWRMANDKGVNLEYQSNALHYCTRPRVLIPGLRT